jgi:hypothetical protein
MTINGLDTYDTTMTLPERRVAEAFFRAFAPTHPIRFYVSRGEYVVQLAVGNHRQEVRDRDLISILAQCARIHDLLTPASDLTEAA